MLCEGCKTLTVLCAKMYHRKNRIKHDESLSSRGDKHHHTVYYTPEFMPLYCYLLVHFQSIFCIKYGGCRVCQMYDMVAKKTQENNNIKKSFHFQTNGRERKGKIWLTMNRTNGKLTNLYDWMKNLILPTVCYAVTKGLQRWLHPFPFRLSHKPLLSELNNEHH